MRKVGLFGIVITLAGIAAWSASTHSAVKAEPPQTIDPLPLEANAKNLPSEESLIQKMWPDNDVVRY
jgi:hypothetical protein